MALREKRLTVEEFREIAALPENDGLRLELEDGLIVEMASSRRINTVTAMRVGTFINNFVLPRDLGYVTGSDGGYVLGPKRVRRPDVGFIAKAHGVTLDGVDFDRAPDLAVEVVSDDEDIFRKAKEYLNAGTRLVWAIYADEREVYVFTLDEDGSVRGQPFGVVDTLSGDPVLPGFMLAVKDIFPE